MCVQCVTASPLARHSEGSRSISRDSLPKMRLPRWRCQWSPFDSAGDARDMGLTPGLRRPLRRNGSPLQDSCLENPMDRGDRWATVHGATRSRTQLGSYVHRQSSLRKPGGKAKACLWDREQRTAAYYRL